MTTTQQKTRGQAAQFRCALWPLYLCETIAVLLFTVWLFTSNVAVLGPVYGSSNATNASIAQHKSNTTTNGSLNAPANVILNENLESNPIPIDNLNENLRSIPIDNLDANLNSVPLRQAPLKRDKRYFNQQQQMGYMHQLILQQAVNYDTQRKNRARTADPVSSTAKSIEKKSTSPVPEEICRMVKSSEDGRLIKSKYCCRRFVREHCEKASLEAEPEGTICEFAGVPEFKSICIGDW